jgi:hypothetical protein
MKVGPLACGTVVVHDEVAAAPLAYWKLMH